MAVPPDDCDVRHACQRWSLRIRCKPHLPALHRDRIGQQLMLTHMTRSESSALRSESHSLRLLCLRAIRLRDQQRNCFAENDARNGAHHTQSHTQNTTGTQRSAVSAPLTQTDKNHTNPARLTHCLCLNPRMLATR